MVIFHEQTFVMSAFMATFMVFIQFSFIFIFYPKFVHFCRADMI
ncbi:hypothetical protein FAM21834_00990 [Lentilactobacillus parabuchneri]|uniref:Uncharacterized protein n=1 Tax=Lentilactobacillus parabuchneri TaxID=152331 RepID=A0A1X1FFK4_9LACO|nr:hypothetical protein FAM21731_01064 [Lentilactobacillus parabuchneri]ORM96481.1 hypothetical protein FAM21809_01086 [Lentilactobacillus parabuchneri]ORN01133.1 hypothetical protein FAM21823_01106 [Lentilactobacillus parabuchneri]ORN04860.1 hypothetical protein FAM21829_00912 [Lentilactobacillus parabuchneri]ORN09216.1 hypothetical protein FAM23163_00913 [Lentilactobacillus parabuchneri]